VGLCNVKNEYLTQQISICSHSFNEILYDQIKEPGFLP